MKTWLVSIFTLAAMQQVMATSDSCSVKMEPLGCWKDTPYKRALSQLLLIGNDPNSPVFSGNMVTHNNYGPWLDHFMCQCATKAYHLGIKVIGVQFHTECWGAVDGHKDYDRYGEADNCINGEKKACPAGSRYCSGGSLSNYVYRIAPTDCDTYYKPVGCYKDSGVKPRPLETYLQNERDYSIPNWNGYLIDWKHWNTYSPAMICRCAEKARMKMHNYFAIQFYGECWTGKIYVSNPKRDGPTDRCIAQNFDSPNINSYVAVGKDRVNYVYHLIPGPAAKN